MAHNFLDAEPIHVSHVKQIMKQQKSNSSPSRVECQWRILEIQEAFDVTASAIPAYQVKHGSDSANHKKQLHKQNIMSRIQKMLNICDFKETIVWLKANIINKWLQKVKSQ